MKLFYLTFIYLFLPTRGCFSQKSEPVEITIQLLSSQTNQPVRFAHIYNESKRYGTISDSAGTFTITANKGDTLIFIALGYLGKYHQVSPENIKDKSIAYLSPRTFEIPEVSIEFPRTYLQFKQAMLAVDTREGLIMPELPRYNEFKTPYLLDTNIIYSGAFRIWHPVSGFYYKHSKREKSKRKVWYMQQQQMKQARVDEKYNRELVKKQTGFEGDDLINFMGFCNFTFNYLFESSPIEIVMAIEEKEEAFRTCCYEKE